MNNDGVVDLEDLKLFSERKLHANWEDVNWCEWVESGYKHKEYLGELYDFIQDYFNCNSPPPPPVDPLAVENANNSPIRLAWGTNGLLYVTDAIVGSIFVYDFDTDPNNVVVAEIKGLIKPLGIVIDNQGNIIIGRDDRDCLEIYDVQGNLLSVIASGQIDMPSDLALDSAGNIYVVDGTNNVVLVYDSNGVKLREISGDFKFPVAVEVAYHDDGTGQTVGEVYIADQGNGLIKVFDLQGNLLRSLGGKIGTMSMNWEGKFIMLQSLFVDNQGWINALDVYICKVQLLDPITGLYQSYYSERGAEPGKLRLPLDVEMDSIGRVAVADYSNKRVEIIHILP